MSYDRVQIDNDSQVDAEHINRIQTNIKRVTDDLATDDRLVKLTFTSIGVDTPLYHNLGRALVGYRIVRVAPNGAAIPALYDGSPSKDPGRFFNVRATALGSVTVEVF